MLSFFKRVSQGEAFGGILLLIATALAMIYANSHLSDSYHHIFVNMGFRHWVNDGLMVIFFFLIGLEIKREMAEGSLSNMKAASVPLIAAIFGVAVPAFIYVAFNLNDLDALRGWAVPTATDIAFSIGVLALLGSRAPLSVKILLTAIAVIDDLIAILVIALFYTAEINSSMLMISFVFLLLMLLMNKADFKSPIFYLIAGFFMWLSMGQTGIHPTIAGVATAICMPIARDTKGGKSSFDKLIHAIHPYSAFFILPVFAFANAGINLKGIGVEYLTQGVVLGIAVGLVVGKVIGITGVLSLLKPAGLNFYHKLGLGFLCGIGFTMSLFIGDLAFVHDVHQHQVKLGVLMGSFISAIMAFIVFQLEPKKRG